MAPVQPCPRCGHRLVPDPASQTSLDQTIDEAGAVGDGDITEFSKRPSDGAVLSSEVTALAEAPPRPPSRSGNSRGGGPPKVPPTYSPPPPSSAPEDLPTQAYERPPKAPEIEQYPSLADTVAVARPPKPEHEMLTVDAEVPTNLQGAPEAPPIPDDSDEPDVFTKTVMDQKAPVLPEPSRKSGQREPVRYGNDILTKTSSGFDEEVYSSSPRPDESQPLRARPGDSQPVGSMAPPPLRNPGQAPSTYSGAPQRVDSYPVQALDALSEEPGSADLPAPASTPARWQEAHPSARKWAEKRLRGKSSPRPLQMLLGILLIGCSAYLALIFLPGHRPPLGDQPEDSALWRFDEQQFLLAAINAGLFAVLGIVVTIRGFFARSGEGSAATMVLGVSFAVLTLMFAGLVLWASV